MLHATITIDGKAYQGEGPETYPANAGGDGWHVANLGELNTLRLGDGEPLRIVGMRNLQSHIERIMRRVGDGQIVAGRVVIEIEAQENA